MAKAKADNNIHIRLDNPLTKRKSILRLTIDLVQLTKRYETVKEIRKQKSQELESLRAVLSDITKLSREARLKEMPIRLKQLEQIRNSSGKGFNFHKVEPVALVSKRKKVKQKKSVNLKRSSIDEQLDALRRKLDSI